MSKDRTNDGIKPVPVEGVHVTFSDRSQYPDEFLIMFT